MDNRPFPHSVFLMLHSYSYDEQDIFGMKNRAKFTKTIDFVEEYLRQISSNIWAFNDKEQNKLTYEVGIMFEYNLASYEYHLKNNSQSLPL